MRQKIRNFMMGRYGHDQLNRFLMILALITVLLGMVVAWKLFSILTFALLVLAYFRMFSRNIAARRRENEMFLARTAGVRKRLLLGKRQWQDRKTHVYFRCPCCGTGLRVPKHKGAIIVKCKYCGQEFERKT